MGASREQKLERLGLRTIEQVDTLGAHLCAQRESPLQSSAEWGAVAVSAVAARA